MSAHGGGQSVPANIAGKARSLSLRAAYGVVMTSLLQKKADLEVELKETDGAIRTVRAIIDEMDTSPRGSDTGERT